MPIQDHPDPSDRRHAVPQLVALTLHSHGQLQGLQLLAALEEAHVVAAAPILRRHASESATSTALNINARNICITGTDFCVTCMHMTQSTVNYAYVHTCIHTFFTCYYVPFHSTPLQYICQETLAYIYIYNFICNHVLVCFYFVLFTYLFYNLFILSFSHLFFT